MRRSYRFEAHSAFQFLQPLTDCIATPGSVFPFPGQLQFRRTNMSLTSKINRLASPAAIAVVALVAAAGAASAGECPAGKEMANAVTGGPDMPVGVVDTVIGSIDLSPKGGEFTDQLLRLRQLTIAPGGIVPWHEHSQRPANIYVLSGTIEEYRASCSVPIIHKAGDVAQEFGKGFAHWWKNTSSEPVVLLSADVFNNKKADDHMM
jgi:quercetin dioxygenase-like cupin family protein